MITLEQIRERLIEAIRTSGYSQAEIARQVGIKSSTVAQYLSGRTMPALDTLANLCVLLEVEPSYILCTDEY